MRSSRLAGATSIGNLGRAASHGCVRLAPANAARFYGLVSSHGMARTRIVVHGDLDLVGRGHLVDDRFGDRRPARQCEIDASECLVVGKFNRPAAFKRAGLAVLERDEAMSSRYSPHWKTDPKVNTERCRASVHDPVRGFSIYQCRRKAVICGEWCKQHDPEARKKRADASTVRWAAEDARRSYQWALDALGRRAMEWYAGKITESELRAACAQAAAKDPTP